MPTFSDMPDERSMKTSSSSDSSPEEISIYTYDAISLNRPRHPITTVIHRSGLSFDSNRTSFRDTVAISSNMKRAYWIDGGSLKNKQINL